MTYFITLDFIGTDRPETSLDPLEPVIGVTAYDQQFDSPVTVMCSIPKTAYDVNDAMFELQWMSNGSVVSSQSVASIRQMLSESKLTVTLIISQFGEADNGNYTCHAKNSNSAHNSSITLIGTVVYSILHNITILL